MDTPPNKPSSFDVKLEKLKARLSRKQSSASMPSSSKATCPLGESYDFCDTQVQGLDSATVKDEKPMHLPRRVSSMALVRTPSQQPDIWEEASTPAPTPKRGLPSSSRRSIDSSRHSMFRNDEDKIRRFLRNLPMPAAESSGSRSTTPQPLRSVSFPRHLADVEDDELDEWIRQLSVSRASPSRGMHLGHRSSMTSIRSMESVKEDNEIAVESQEIGTFMPGHDATMRPACRHPKDRVSLSSPILTSTPKNMNSPSPARSPGTPIDYVGKWTHRIAALNNSTELQTPPSIPSSPALSTLSTSNLDVPKELRLSLGHHPNEENVNEDDNGDAKSASSLDVLLRAEAKHQGPNALTGRNVEAFDAAMEASWMTGSGVGFPMVSPVPPNVVESEAKVNDELKLDEELKMKEEPKLGHEMKVDDEVKVDDVLGVSILSLSLSLVPSNVWDDGAKGESELKLGEPKPEEGPKMNDELKMDEPEPVVDEPKLDGEPQVNENETTEPNLAGNPKMQELAIMPAMTVSVHAPQQARSQALTVMKPKTLIDQPPPSTTRPTSALDFAVIAVLVVYGTLLVGTIVMIFCNFGDNDRYDSVPEFLVMHGPGLTVVICGVYGCLRSLWREMTGGERDVVEE